MTKKLMTLLVAVLAWAGTAEAGRIYIPAQNFQFGTAATDCTAINTEGATYDFHLRRCPDAGSNAVNLYAEVFCPFDAANSWKYAFQFQTVDADLDACGWSARAMVIDVTCDPTTAMAGTQGSAAVGNEAAGLRTSTGWTAATPVRRCSTAANCTGTACTEGITRIEVQLDRTNTTASSCDLAGIVIDTNP